MFFLLIMDKFEIELIKSERWIERKLVKENFYYCRYYYYYLSVIINY